jgi:DUF1365 family protein
VSPLSLYLCSVMHARMRPRAHRFYYRVLMVAIDLDRLRDADRASPLLSIDGFNLLSVHRKDHGARTDADLASHVRTLLSRHGIPTDGGRVVLVCQPRVLGFAFNPLSLYFAYDAEGALAGIVHEVRNTYGEQHCYVMPAAGDPEKSHRWECQKTFRVSPFLGLSHRYFFRVSRPDSSLRVHILERDSEGAVMAAALKGERRDLTNLRILGAFARTPLLGFKVLAAIHWQALRLWSKGVRLAPSA